MTQWSMGGSIADPKPGLWYQGYSLDRKLVGKKEHFHMLPLGFPALAVMQQNRYYSLAILGRERSHGLSAPE
jgi:hypothetical protein